MDGKEISVKNWIIIWVVGLAGQICWNVENSWFNNFVYAKIAPSPTIIAWMVGVSAVATTLSTFLMGTLSDRVGRRKPFIAAGYIFWGLFTIAFGAAEFLPKKSITSIAVYLVGMDAIMSFFGSMGYDAGFNPWTTDISDVHNRGKLGGALAALPVLATIFGAIVSGIVIDAIDFFAFFVVMGVSVMAVGVLVIITLEDDPELKAKRHPEGYWHQFFSVFRIKTLIRNKELFWVFMVMLVYFIGFNVYFPYITIYFVNYLNLSYTMTGVIQGVGLVAAVLCTIPAARFIDRGRSPFVILFSVIINFIGLWIVTFSAQTIVLLIGTFAVGTGYVLTLQTLTAWNKNLYPEDQRGQFEGLKQIFFVCLPMIIGPAIASFIINRYGVAGVVNGTPGMIPTEALFRISAILNCLTLIPLIPAFRLHKARLLSIKTDEKFSS